MIDIAALRALVDRLRETDWSGKDEGKPVERDTTCWHRNPDGPEAAAAIEGLLDEVERLREKLDLVRDDLVSSVGRAVTEGDRVDAAASVNQLLDKIATTLADIAPGREG